MELHVLIFYSGSLSAVYEACLACDNYLKQYLLKYFRFAVLQFFDRCSYFVCVSYRWGFVCIQVPPAFLCFVCVYLPICIHINSGAVERPC